MSKNVLDHSEKDNIFLPPVAKTREKPDCCE